MQSFSCFSVQIFFAQMSQPLFRVIYSRLSILNFVLNIVKTMKTVQKALNKHDLCVVL